MTRYDHSHAKDDDPNHKIHFWRHELEKLDTTRILLWTVDSYYPRLALITCFNPEGCVLLTMLSEIVPKVTVVCHKFDYQIQALWSISQRLYTHCGLTIEPMFISAFGPPEYSLTPMFDAQVVCTRRQETPGTPVMELSPKTGIPTVAPLARWTREAIFSKLRRDGVVSESYLNQWNHR